MIPVLALSLICALWAPQSQPPPPTPTAHSNQQEKVEGDKSHPPNKEDTPPHALVFATATTQSNSQPATETGKTSSAKNGKESSFDYNALAVTIFTAALAYLAWLQWRAMNKQAEYMRHGLTETKRAADAAKVSADVANESLQLAKRTMLVTERAIIMLEKIQISQQNRQPTFDQYSFLIFTFKNFGRSAAYSVKFSGLLTCGELQNPIPEIPEALVAPQATNSLICKSFGLWMPQEIVDLVVAGERTLTYEVRATYRDGFNQEHQYQSTGRYSAASRGMVVTQSS
jgi:hypothetical protein